MTACRIFNTVGREAAHFILEELDCKEISVGRSKTCTIPLVQAEPTLSREHFIIFKKDDSWRLRDCSKRGTFKNCEKIHECELRPGDVFRFGQFIFCFGDKTMPSPFEISWQDTNWNVRRKSVIWPGRNGIGSSHDNEIFINLPGIARFHGCFNYTGEKLLYSNRSSLCKTSVNGEDVKAEIEISEGDVLNLGQTEITIEKAIRHIVPVVRSEGGGKQLAASKKRSGHDQMTMLFWIGGIILGIAFLLLILSVFLMN